VGKILRALGYAWALPMSIIGILVGMTFCWITDGFGARCKESGWVDGALVIEHTNPFPGPWKPYVGITLGWVVLLAPGWSGQTVVHEQAHVRQCKILGPLVLLAYPLCSLVAVMRGGHWYRDNWLEKQAREHAGQ